MQTLRKKNSPCKFKNEPTRFLGEGVSFKAKLIGILEVSEARGDRMCQAALADLKMAIRAAGEHKQRIAVQVSIEGLRLRDEKTGDCLYHHPVHKISFIAQDMSDSRAFGYIFGSPDTGHRFFGIKTDKAASQVVLAMRDLFQVVFDLKKKEIELAKQHIEQNAIKFRSGIFVEPAPDTKGAAGSEVVAHRIRALNSEVEKPAERKTEVQGGVIADLLDLQFELNSLQQGIHQMDKITPDNPRPPSEDPFETDPFGDSFANMKLSEMSQVRDNVQPILPPPPSSSKRGHLERQQTLPAPSVSSTSSPATVLASKTPPPQGSVHWFDKETENLFNEGELSSLAMKAAATAAVTAAAATAAANSSTDKEKDGASSSVTPTLRKSPQIDVFTELDPLGTGLIKPYVDKKDFFQHLKNPPKKVLKDLVTTTSGDTFPANFNLSHDPLEPVQLQPTAPLANDAFDDDLHHNFADFNKCDQVTTEHQPQVLSKSSQDSPKTRRTVHHQPLSVSLPPEDAPPPKRAENEATESIQTLVRLPSPKRYLQSARKREFDIDLAGSRTQSLDRPFPVDFTSNNESPASPLRSCSSDANSRLSSSSAEMDIVPEPPPRGAGSILINPPPLPPKKQAARGAVKPPPRPPHSDGHFHYDFIEREEASPSPTRKELRRSPAKDLRNRFDDDFSPPPPQLPKRSELVATFPAAKFEDSFAAMTPTTLSSLILQNSTTPVAAPETRKAKPSLDITLSQLTSSNLGELANTLGMTVSELTSLTLQQLTECLATLTAKEASPDYKVEREPEVPAKPQHRVVETSFVFGEPLFKADFDQGMKLQTEQNSFDKYAVFRELLELEQRDEPELREDENGAREQEEEVEPTREEKEKEEGEEEEEKEKEKEKEERKESLEEVEIREIVSVEEGVPTIPLANLTVSLPPLVKDPLKSTEDMEEQECEEDLAVDVSPEHVNDLETKFDGEELSKEENVVEEMELEKENEDVENETREEMDAESEKLEADKTKTEEIVEKEEEKSATPIEQKSEIQSSVSSANDRYAALREIIEETTSDKKIGDETIIPSPETSTLPGIDLMSLFSTPLSNSLGAPKSPKKVLTSKEEELKVAAMDIFEEIKMLNSGTARKSPGCGEKLSGTGAAGFEDTFSPFPLPESAIKSDKEEVCIKEDPNWAKFDSSVFHSDKSSGEGTSPWSPDGKEFQGKEPGFKPPTHRNSGDSDNEWKDEEESEGSNGRPRDDGFWGPGGKSRHPSGFEDSRGYYDRSSPPGSADKERGFRDRTGRKVKGSPWPKGAHRSRDPSPWHEEQTRWEDEHRGPRYISRKVPFKDEEESYAKAHWKCRPKQTKPRPWSGEREGFWHDHPSYEEERKRRMMLWSEEDRDRFSSQESMGYDDDERWARRWSNEYERRRCREEEGRFWARRGPETDYAYREPRDPRDQRDPRDPRDPRDQRDPRDPRDPRDTREPYRVHEAVHYCRESRERARDYAPPGWEDEYGGERDEESPRYSSRKRPWPKRPNSATESRNAEVIYGDSRPKYAVSRSECSDNDSDPYHRPLRSRSRESYWGSDQEFEGWNERPCWSEGPENPTKTETLHRRRINRHRPRVQTKSQSSPFEDDFAQSLEQGLERAEPSPDPFVPGPESRLAPEEQKIEPVALSPRAAKEALRREPRSYKRSSYRHSPFEEDLTPTASVSSDTSDRQRLGSDLKATPEELPRDTKDTLSADGFVSEDSGRDSFFNGDPRFDDDAFAFKSELEDSVPERATTLPLKNSRQMKCGGGGKIKSDLQYIKKSESVNIFVRESDPFDDDDFFN